MESVKELVARKVHELEIVLDATYLLQNRFWCVCRFQGLSHFRCLGQWAWCVWGLARWQYSRQLVPLLRAAIEEATAIGRSDVVEALVANLAEEDAPGAASHEMARSNFYWGLGLPFVAPGMWLVPVPGVPEMLQTFEGLLRRSPLETKLGAILYIEASLPMEFRRILAALEEQMADRFGWQINSWGQSNLARRYLEDHIAHDPRHYGELLSAIGNELTPDLHLGVTTAYIAKWQLYHPFFLTDVPLLLE